MKLSPNFSLEEFTFSQSAARKGINNDPTPEIVARLVAVAHQLERVRSVLGDRGVHISSGYRCPDLNKLVGGSKTSAHCEGWAVDFTVSGLTPKQVCEKIRDSGIKFDQLIHEFGQWTHLSFAPALRGSVLTATLKGGETIYETGIR